jgi:integrase
LNLTWKDVDFESQLITIAAKKESQRLLAWDPKSRRNRIVPVSDQSAQLLADLQLRAEEGFPYIFISPQRLKRIRERQRIGTWTPRSQIINNLDRDFRILRCKAGVDECVIHDLRRSAITNWAKKLPIQVVQELAGHADISTTRKYYLAVRSEDLVSANSFLNEILAKMKTI